MKKETFIDNEAATLIYYPDYKIVHHTFHKFIYGEHFREVLMTGLDLFEKYGCNKWLSDDRANPVLNQEDKVWGDENWTPKVIATGWKYWAMVMPEEVLGKIGMERLTKEYIARGVEVKAFTNPDDALAWLMSLED